MHLFRSGFVSQNCLKRSLPIGCLSQRLLKSFSMDHLNSVHMLTGGNFRSSLHFLLRPVCLLNPRRAFSNRLLATKFSSSMIAVLRRRCRGFRRRTFRSRGNGDGEGCGEGDPKPAAEASGHPLSFEERGFWTVALRDSDRLCRFFLRLLRGRHNCQQERCRRRRRCRRRGRRGDGTRVGSLRVPALLLSRQGASAIGAGAR